RRPEVPRPVARGRVLHALARQVHGSQRRRHPRPHRHRLPAPGVGHGDQGPPAAVRDRLAGVRRLRQTVRVPRRRELVFHEDARPAAERRVHRCPPQPGRLHGVSDAGRRQRADLPHQPRNAFLIMRRRLIVVGIACFTVAALAPRAQPRDGYEVNDTHFHLTNYVQEGTDIRDVLKIMGTKVGRVALFGIPLQQQWSYGNTGDYAPTYYLQTDAPLYYYSFTDAFIAMAYRSLAPADRARFDPMITGFNPADMYAADHVRRVLTTFPGVFSGIGEFTIHKEFVSSKVAGETASLTNPALDRLLDFAGEAGLVTLIHNDIDVPFPKPGQEPYQAIQ